MTLSEWRDEVEYCVDLVENGGDFDVPADYVLNYLKMQAKSAAVEGATTSHQALEELITDWMGG